MEKDEHAGIIEQNKNLKNRVEELEKLLTHDPHTGLPIRRVMETRLHILCEKAKQNGEKIGVGILRLDKHYTRIRHTRDRMKVFLFVTGMRIKKIIGEENVYQSDRADEFLLVIRKLKNEEHLTEIANEISQSVRQPHDPPATDVSFGCHIGLAMFPEHGNTFTEIMVNAEIALGVYEAKKEHGYIYSPELGSQYHEDLDIESDLFHSIQRGLQGFHIAYQPIVTGDLELYACEALLRWESSRFGSVPPSRFVPIAEESGRINILGRWILYNALRQIGIWKDERKRDIPVSVNVSPIQLRAYDFVDTVIEALGSLGLEGKSLFLEVTESTIMEDTRDTILKFQELRGNNIKILLDDFGTGYSSLEYLSALPIDILKIAKPFVDNMHKNSKSLEIINTVINMSRNFGFKTLAEGVESNEQLEALASAGCDYIQGYIVSQPLGADAFAKRFMPGARKE